MDQTQFKTRIPLCVEHVKLYIFASINVFCLCHKRKWPGGKAFGWSKMNACISLMILMEINLLDALANTTVFGDFSTA